MSFRLLSVCLSGYMLLCAPFLIAAPQPVLWHEGTDKLPGATWQYSYSAAKLAWQQPMGSWFDSKQQYLGNSAYSEADAAVSKTPYLLNWQLQPMLAQQQIKPGQKLDLLLRNQPGSKGTTEFYSKEQNSLPPQLKLITNKRTISLDATMDTFLDKSTFRSLGTRPQLKVGPANVALLQFAIPLLAEGEQLTNASLQLETYRQYGANRIGVYLLAEPEDKPTDPPLTASNHIVFSEDFSNRRWSSRWHDISARNRAERVTAPQRPEQQALKVNFTPSQHLALDMSIRMKQLLPDEPEALYFQYDLYLADNWFSDRQGGKFPGLAGTYQQAGWGGRSADGSNGWSARGQFGDTIVSNDTLNNTTPIGFYAYYPANGQRYGAAFYWDKAISKLQPGRWYTITQYVEMNTPGQQDGILRAWVDNIPVFENTAIRFRDTPELKIERLWMNFYHGGTAKPSKNMDLYITNILLALPAD